MNPRVSDDGPIFWVRPGEQMVPTTLVRSRNGAGGDSYGVSPLKRKRALNELSSLTTWPRTSDPRTIKFEDRTKAHADHTGKLVPPVTTAAVGKRGNYLGFDMDSGHECEIVNLLTICEMVEVPIRLHLPENAGSFPLKVKG